MTSTTTDGNAFARAEELPESARPAVRDLILCLADSKRLLGMRYAEWILGAPELEAGIACASMAQDEWGHGRLLYALLKDFGDDVDRIEHGRQPEEYRSMEALDRAPDNWAQFSALNAFADAALTVQLEALAESAYQPLRQRVQKLLEEEHFHAAHGAAWLRRLGNAGGEARAEAAAAARALLPALLQWFGPDSGAARTLRENGIVRHAPAELRRAFTARVQPLLELVQVPVPEPAFDGFDERTRRTAGGAPDAATIAKIRGDKNRAFLMD